MKLTEAQLHRIAYLREQYGKEDVVALEHTDQPTGLVRMRWGVAPMIGRELTIRPNGGRLAWDTVDLGLPMPPTNEETA